MNIVKRFVGVDDFPVSGVPSASPLPGGLVIAPGVYTFNGQNYDCTAEGLYKFWTPMTASQNRIVYQSNIDVLMSSISWLCVNGRADEALTISQKTNAATNSKLRMLCGKTVEWARALCSSLGVQARTARTLTASTPTNYYDGHVMIEVFVSGKWKLFDLANGNTYENTTGGSSLLDVVPFKPEILLKRIDDDGYAIEPYVASSFDSTSWIELTMRTPAQIRAELERVLQIPGIDHTDNLTYFYLPPGMESAAAYVTGLSTAYRIITKSAWIALFYP
jgi:hypothetical protein